MTQPTTVLTDTHDRHRGEILGLFVMAVSVALLVTAAVRPAGNVFSILLDLVGIAEVYIGAGIYVISLYLWFVGVEKFRGRTVLDSGQEYTGLVVFFLAAIAAVSWIGGEGGLAGDALMRLFAATFGGPGGFILTLACLLVGISLTFRVLIGALVASLFEALRIGAQIAAGLVATAVRGLLRTATRLAATAPAPAPLASETDPDADRKKRDIAVHVEPFIEPEPVFISSDPAPAPKGESKAEAQAEAKPARATKSRAREKDDPARPADPGPAAPPEPSPAKPARKKAPAIPIGYQLPPMDLLPRPEVDATNAEEDLREKADKIVRTLRSFHIDAGVTQITHGPSVTRFELVPGAGVKVSKIVELADNIALNLAATSIRIEAPIPGKSAIGIEVPNEKQSPVFFADLIRQKEFAGKKNPLLIALGKTITGQPVVADLANMPHLLIAGTTGSGKSVCMNTIIASILFRSTPDQVRMIMIDPKQVELSVYDAIPHLLHPVVVNPRKAQSALLWVVSEMERRYKLLAHYNVRKIDSFNKYVADVKAGVATNVEGANLEELAGESELPFIIVIIDELADLMMAGKQDKSTVEAAICRIAQMARAVGIHLVVATQRPSVNIITGVIKANMPSRIAFRVSSNTDSRVILDMAGAESLLGRGDMLYNPVGAPKPIRVQGAYVSDEEVVSLVKWLKSRYPTGYEEHVAEAIALEDKPAEEEGPIDPMIEEAIRLTVTGKSGSTSMLQRILKVGHNRALELMAQMERLGVVGPFEDKKPRQVIWTPEELEERLKLLDA